MCAAETGFKLRSSPDTVRAPDIAFVVTARIPADGGPDGFYDGPPDLAVEVLSPDDRMVDVLDKVRDYLDAGTLQVWIVAPKSNTISVYKSLGEVFVLTEKDTLVGTGPLDGFECSIAELLG